MDATLERRAQVHRALGDPHRLAIVDHLRLTDRTPSELLAATGMPSNLLAFHLGVLEEAGLVSRQVSAGDRRRRYVSLLDDALPEVTATAPGRLELADGPVLFVCTHNAARSQLAAALWASRTGGDALSAGADPAAAVHPHAVEVARRHGLDLRDTEPRGYAAVDTDPALVVSLCDRAREAGLPFDAPVLHWSVSIGAAGGLDDYERAYVAIHRRVDALARAVAA